MSTGLRGITGVSVNVDTVTTDTAGRDIAKAKLKELASLLSEQKTLQVRINELKTAVEKSVKRYGKLEVEGVAIAEMENVKGKTDSSKKGLIKALGEPKAIEIWNALLKTADRVRLAITLSK